MRKLSFNLFKFTAVFTFILGFVVAGCGGGGGGGEGQTAQPPPTTTPQPPEPGELRKLGTDIVVEGLEDGESFTLSSTDTNGRNNTLRIDKNGNVSLEGLDQNSGVRLKLKDFPEGKVCIFTGKASTDRVLYIGINRPSLRIACMDKLPTPNIRANPGVTPSVATIPGRDGGPPTPVAALSAGGKTVDVALNELIVATRDDALIDAFIARWNAQVIKKIELKELGELARDIYLMRIDLSGLDVDTSNLGELWQEVNPVATGDIDVSDENLLKLMYIAAFEAKNGLDVSFNYVFESAGDSTLDPLFRQISDGEISEDGNTFYGISANVFDWPYMNAGGPLDINVIGAWTALLMADRNLTRTPQVNVVVFDGGIKSPSNYSTRADIDIVNENIPNPAFCGGSPCRWHGTKVANILAGEIGDGTLIAGTGTPAIKSLRMYAWSTSSFLDILEYIGSVLKELFLISVDVTGEFKPHIINMSGALRVPALATLLTNPILDTLGTYARGMGVLPFASAGNDGENVDAEDCFLACWEEATWIPCEVSGVMCVAGTDWNARMHPSSNEGSAAVSEVVVLDFIPFIGDIATTFRSPSTDSVDIWAPYELYVPLDDYIPEVDFGPVELGSGTSFSSPFTAGIAALVWRAMYVNDALNVIMRFPPGSMFADDLVDAILFTTAKSLADGPGYRLVQAWKAVDLMLRLGRSASDDIFIEILSPHDGTEIVWGPDTTLLSAVALPNPATLTQPEVIWSSSVSGELGMGKRLGLTLEPGEHTITATARLGEREAEDSVNIRVINYPPEVLIVSPRNETQVCPGQRIRFIALVRDENNSETFPFPEDNIVWTASQGGRVVANMGAGSELTYLFSPGGTYTIDVTATDEYGLEDSDYITLNVKDECVGNAPEIAIVEPTNGSTFNQLSYSSVTFSASASDIEDGDISSNIVWYVNGELAGTGASITYDFTGKVPDDYTLAEFRITAEVTDSDGNTAEMTVIIYVGNMVL